jgi:hypothetical protein
MLGIVTRHDLPPVFSGIGVGKTRHHIGSPQVVFEVQPIILGKLIAELEQGTAIIGSKWPDTHRAAVVECNGGWWSGRSVHRSDSFVGAHLVVLPCIIVHCVMSVNAIHQWGSLV